jgi:rubredoxin
MPAKKKQYRCTVCAHIYDPAAGNPEAEIAPGTAFEDLPADWICPDCGATKDDFEPVAD